MIVLTRPDGQPTALSAVLVERVEATPETVVTMVDGTRYTVAESVREVLDKLEHYHVSVLVAATEQLGAPRPRRPALRLIQGERSR